MSIKNMRKKTKNIVEDCACMEKSASEGNIVKNVKVLGTISKNGRKYPLPVMEKALAKYENAIINIDHSTEPRKFSDRFGRLKNVKMAEDGIYGDLEVNDKHPMYGAFDYFVKHDPQAIGLSHAAIAKTRMDREGVEIVEEITDVESVDLVANPATNKGLFESYTAILESQMKKKDKCEMDEKKEMDMEKEKKEVGMEEAKEPEEKKDEKKEEVEETYESYEEFMEAMSGKCMEILKSEMSLEEKHGKLMGMWKHDDDEKKEEISDEVMGLDEEKMDDKEAKMKAEEFIRAEGNKGLKLLLEEIDSFRLKEKIAKEMEEAKKACEENKLNEKLVTEAFVDVLVNSDRSKWKVLIEDRKGLMSVSKTPISTQFGGNSMGLTVDELVKQLRS